MQKSITTILLLIGLTLSLTQMATVQAEPFADEIELVPDNETRPLPDDAEPPTEVKVFKAERYFTISSGVGGTGRRSWSRTLEFAGPVIWVGGSWRTNSGIISQAFLDTVIVNANTITISGRYFRSGIFAPFARLSARVSVRYLSEPTQPGVDVNSDDVVNVQDLVFVASQFGPSGEGSVDMEAKRFTWKLNDADVNWDGFVNIQDLVLVAGAIGEDAASPSIPAQSLAILSAAGVQQWLEQVRQVNLTDTISQRGILFLKQLLAALTPKETALLPNYPNPFNPETWIPYHLAEPADVTLSIYSADGKLVRTLALGHRSAGVYESKSRAAYWDGRNTVGERVASGVYFYTLTAGDFAATGKMLIVK